ncbi:MAG: hypothetical protein LJE70_10165 [Chromatiaceae bacterium]|nr:hypothetical protein [Chromatiaceae bacterium]
MKGSRADFHVERLHNNAAAVRPEALKDEYETLKCGDVSAFRDQAKPPLIVHKRNFPLYPVET